MAQTNLFVRIIAEIVVEGECGASLVGIEIEKVGALGTDKVMR
jgi:hypothetical protein